MNPFTDEEAYKILADAKIAAFDEPGADGKPKGRPKLDEIFSAIEQRVLKENGSAFANICLNGVLSLSRAREVIVWEAALKLLEAVRENQPAIFKVLEAA